MDGLLTITEVSRRSGVAAKAEEKNGEIEEG